MPIDYQICKTDIPVNTHCTIICEQAYIYEEDIAEAGPHSDISYYCPECWDKISEKLTEVTI